MTVSEIVPGERRTLDMTLMRAVKFLSAMRLTVEIKT
jgi:hypothetical protein